MQALVTAFATHLFKLEDFVFANVDQDVQESMKSLGGR